MTKKLEEIFDLEPKQSDEEKIDVSEPLPVKADIPEQTLNNIEKIEAALPRVKGLEAGDSEMDELSELAQKSYKDLMDLGMNVDSRFSAEIFSVAANLLNHSISAKTAKINKKLKMVDLQVIGPNIFYYGIFLLNSIWMMELLSYAIVIRKICVQIY